MPPIEAVLIDVGGVLILPDHDRISAALERADVHVDRARLDRAHYAGVDALDGAVEHLLSEFATGAVWSRIIPGSVDALQSLAALDVKLAIVSNAGGDTEPRLRE